MRKLAVKTNWGAWQWVVRFAGNHNNIVTSVCKDHALWPKDLEYFQKRKPRTEFALKETLND